MYLELNNTSVEKYIDNNYADAKVQKIDYSENLILFSTGNGNQYFLGQISKLGKYYFNFHNEDAWVVQQPQMLIVSFIEDVGNVAWGFFDFDNSSNEVHRIELEYKSTENNLEYTQDFIVDNCAFFEYLPQEILSADLSYTPWRYNLKAYNNENALMYEVVEGIFIYERNMN